MTQRRTGDALNVYGDRFVPAGGSGHGGHISDQRKDDLDRLALERAAELAGSPSARPPVVYDIGCGRGAMAAEFCRAGCAVVACDVEPMPALVGLSRGSGDAPPLTVVQEDARRVDWAGFAGPDIVYSQRFLHYLRFEEASKLLSALTGGRGQVSLFLSMSGLDSELGSGYARAPLKGRFARLERRMARKHGIAQKVCLYDLEDAGKLASACGLEVVRSWTSDFGNVKLVATT